FLVGQPTSALFRNKGDGTFENVTAQSGITRKLDWMGCAVGDYDNDGYPDLFVTGYGDCALYRNNAGKGATIFTEVTKQAGIINRNWTSSAAFADADHDGLLDLYVTSYVEFNEKSIQFCTYRGVQSSCGPRFYDAQKGIFYRNLGNGRFVDATKQFGFDTAHGKGLGVIFSDYDNDGKIDLYVANDETPADHFRNLGNGRFENVAALVGTAYDRNG
ncbi:MAG: VCBS repeat-containing protein, partial [Abditibacteriales bacterium]|nr:VCBS repeat-containing protein [Abditibacteriales bacterium]